MIGVDSNVLVRFFVDDDAKQAESARRFMKQRTRDDPAFVSALVLAEFAWALKANYDYEKDRVYAALAIVLGSFNIVVEQEKLIAEALRTGRARGADVADSIIAALALEAGCERIVTFDRSAARGIPGMELLK